MTKDILRVMSSLDMRKSVRKAIEEEYKTYLNLSENSLKTFIQKHLQHYMYTAATRPRQVGEWYILFYLLALRKKLSAPFVNLKCEVIINAINAECGE